MLAHDRRDFMKDLSESLSRSNVNIVNIELKTEEAFIHNNMLIEVRNRNHLGQIIKRVSKVKGMISVERLNGDISAFQKVDQVTSDLKYKN
jgi:(p)ppGpp synthase/HD superfamily hydrolase